MTSHANSSPKSRAKSRTPARKKDRGRRTGGFSSTSRFLARLVSVVVVVGFLLLCLVGDLYVHHPADWLDAHRSIWTRPLEYLGNRTAFLTDALGWTGRDAVNTPDDPIPTGQVFFAGAPCRTGSPAPADLVVLDRGEYKIGWSPSLRHPVWVAYHVPRAATHEAGKRPGFRKDRSVDSSPSPNDYAGTGFDRGHMVPNRAIVTRFGPDFQRRTFEMTNIAPQRPSLNRGPWREMEQRIVDLWTAKYGEIWVIAGCIPATDPQDRKRLGKSTIDVPEHCYMLIASQTEDSLRVLAVLFDQKAGRWDFPVHNIVSVDELEQRTGLDFFPDMQRSLQMSLESDRPTRLWPIRALDLIKLILIRFT